MRNLLLFIVKYGPFFLFVLLEIFCFSLIVNYNQKQRSIFINSTNLFSGYLNEKTSDAYNFLDLDEENEKLRRENAKLLQEIINNKIVSASSEIDTIGNAFTLMASNICAKTINLRNNTLTLCKGSNDGIKEGMGVIGDHGVIGIVKNVSPRYSTVLSLLHSQSRVSIALKNKIHHGYITWDTSDPRYVTAHAIRKYAEMKVGDTIVTSGYSTIFPKNLDLGVVEDFKVESGGETFLTRVKLFEDYNSVNEVYVIHSHLKMEFDSLNVLNE